MSQTPRNRPPVRRVVPGQEAGGQAPPPRAGSRQPQYQNQRPRQRANVNAPRRSDPFPLVIGGIFVVLVVGLLVLVFLFSMNRGGTPGPVTTGGQPTTVGASDVNNNNSANTVPTQAPGADLTQAAAPTVEPAPRMPLDQFLALYDDPAKRPLIIDVRAKESYDQGHIAGAISFPESDVDTRINELPKDKLIVAYCQ